MESAHGVPASEKRAGAFSWMIQAAWEMTQRVRRPDERIRAPLPAMALVHNARLEPIWTPRWILKTF